MNMDQRHIQVLKAMAVVIAENITLLNKETVLMLFDLSDCLV